MPFSRSLLHVSVAMENKTEAVIVLYENKDVLVVNKPAGLIVHPDGKTNKQTLTTWILRHYPAISGVGEALTLSNGEVIERPGIVHRLDQETSGVMVIAKNQGTFLMLKEQFQSRSLEKRYNAFIYGELKEEKSVIDRPIGKSRSDFRRRSAQRGARGELRSAVTEYRVLAGTKEASFMEVIPKTGRTHQIRVHFKAIHHPIICDKLYAPKKDCILGFTRLALHARTLTLTLPSGERETFEAPLPSDFENALTFLKKAEA